MSVRLKLIRLPTYRMMRPREDEEYKPDAPQAKPKKPKKKPSLAKKKPSLAPSKPTGRRSKRLRGKRVDYGSLETKYDLLEG